MNTGRNIAFYIFIIYTIEPIAKHIAIYKKILTILQSCQTLEILHQKYSF